MLTKQQKAEKVLNILIKNDFDCFGYSNLRVKNNEAGIDLSIHFGHKGSFVKMTYFDKENTEYWTYLYSPADLATNKSALEAAWKVRNANQNIKNYIGWGELQKDLIKELTNNNDDKFWNIWLEFMERKNDA